MKELLYELYQLATDIIMHMPIAFIRLLWLKAVCKQVGNGVQISRHVHLISPHKISLGDNVFINRHATLDGRFSLAIGDNVDIGEFSSIWSLQHDPDDENHTTKGGPTIIMDHAWIAPHSIILPNVTVGKGCVVGTGSVVTKSTDPMTLVAGVPAKTIRKRNNSCQYKLTYKIYL